VAAAVAESAFLSLDAPVSRLAMPDVPSPHSPPQLASVVPNSEIIRFKIEELCSF